MNVIQTKMKTRVLKIMYDNPFTILDHEHPYIYLTEYYQIFGTLGSSETNEKAVFLRLFAHSLIG